VSPKETSYAALCFPTVVILTMFLKGDNVSPYRVFTYKSIRSRSHLFVCFHCVSISYISLRRVVAFDHTCNRSLSYCTPMLNAIGPRDLPKGCMRLQTNAHGQRVSIRSIAWSCQHCHRRFHTEKNLYQHRLLNRHF
jgi:hypothetical protein